MLSEIISKFSKLELSDENLTLLRKELSHLGLDKYIPETIAKIVIGDKND